ncbi:uncharacterized protein LOC125870027 [Solanum stenotomum]|uniref:uncharacterized protein LOC125870027 n=1 Tax=Solanum stenotomum TaxID=172797 RepID=UPI0020D0F6A1|nr:uncharacterized protein LOC125870027 [Solanum stenotomum]
MEVFLLAWPIVGEDVTNAVLEFFQNNKILRQIYSTSIALIPKIDKPEFASQFRPISCCNAIYKCISKLICSRLKSAISLIVAENQSAFVQGRSMMHNVLICHDILRHYNLKNASPRCLMKIDLKKAYDIVSWEFLEEVLIHFGFPRQFVKWIMLGVPTTMLSVKVNGGSHGFFADFKYHPMCKKLKLTHLIFADDLMIFCKGNVDSVNRVMKALAHFNVATGLEANLEKSNVYLAGVDERVKTQILARTGFSEVFILPQSILKKVDKICRDFLWGSSADKKNVALVACDKMCLPKRQGGLNIKGLVQSQKIYADSKSQTGKYSITKSYQALMDPKPRWNIVELVWTSMAMPKHRFMTWLAVQGRLLTQERKLRLQIQEEDAACCLCEEKVMEANVHLFEDCKWTSDVWQAMHQWTEVPVHNIGIVQVLKNIKGNRLKQFKKEIMAAICGTIIYHTWRARNWRRFRDIYVRKRQ